MKAVGEALKVPNNIIKEYWGEAVGIAAVGSALYGEGDLRTRAIRAGQGAMIAGGVVLGCLTLLP